MGKRNKQAKDKQLSFTAIVWSKAQFMTRSVQRTLCHCEASTGVPAGYCVPVGKRNKQAKDKQLSLATIVWSKVKFMTRDVAISRKGILVIIPTQDADDL